MKINIYLPYKENFDLNKASAVSISVKNNLFHSFYKNNVRVFGNKTENPIYENNFFAVKKSYNFFKSKNKHIAKIMCDIISNENDQDQIIEIHNRPYIFNYVLKRLPKKKICLFFHNNPKDMKGSKTLNERKFILEKASTIYCVSDYIKGEFLDGINTKHNNIFTLHNGVERTLKVKSKKDKEILFVGRIVHEKGVHLFVKAASLLAKEFPDWKYSMIGTTRLGLNSNDSFGKKIIDEFKKIGPQAEYFGFLNQEMIYKKMSSASVIVVPSIWQEPFGLVLIEAMSFGLAIVTSNYGGIPEIIEGNGIIIDEINHKKIYLALYELMTNNKKLEKYQNLSWENFNYSSKLSSEKLDKYREKLLNS